ncbi:MAG TPA: flagellar hook-basal body complex protein FliE [Longimicrobiaceae bacterium]|nr:flagellar hook-basal body complex protein FliE [Longimicrobiaceae bacterium]
MSIPVGWAAKSYLEYTQKLAAQSSAGLGAPGGGSAEGASFGDTLKQAINGVSDAQDNARAQMNAYASGEPVELHQVMAATEEAGIALQMMVAVRNKFTEAYRTVMTMES